MGLWFSSVRPWQIWDRFSFQFRLKCTTKSGSYAISVLREVESKNQKIETVWFSSVRAWKIWDRFSFQYVPPDLVLMPKWYLRERERERERPKVKKMKLSQGPFSTVSVIANLESPLFSLVVTYIHGSITHACSREDRMELSLCE